MEHPVNLVVCMIAVRSKNQKNFHLLFFAHSKERGTPNKSCPDITFMVDWELKTDHLSIPDTSCPDITIMVGWALKTNHLSISDKTPCWWETLPLFRPLFLKPFPRIFHGNKSHHQGLNSLFISYDLFCIIFMSVSMKRHYTALEMTKYKICHLLLSLINLKDGEEEKREKNPAVNIQG